jgi:hypothetical protein
MIPRRSILGRRPGKGGGTTPAAPGARPPTPRPGPGPAPTWRGRLHIDRLGVVGSSAIAGLILVAGVAIVALLGGERFGSTSSATATPVGSQPVGSQPPDPAVAAFVALATDPARSMRIETTTTALVGGTRAEVASTLDHVGATYAGSLLVTDTNTRTPTDVIVLPPDAYARDPTGPWRKGAAPRRPLDPFFGLGAATPIADLGLETVEGVELRHLRLAMLPIDTTFAADVREVVYDSTAFDLWIDDQGHPVTGTFELLGSGLTHEGAEPERRVPLSLRTEYNFSRVGEPIEILPPTT